MIFNGDTFENYAYVLNTEKARCEAPDCRLLCYKLRKNPKPKQKKIGPTS